MIDSRNVALDILTDIFEKDVFSDAAVDTGLRRYPALTKQDRSFITRLCLGTVERRMTLDFAISQISSTPLNKIKPLVRNLLRMTAYQILFMETEDYAACNCAVKIVRTRGLNGLAGFVNAVSRNLVRKREELLSTINDTSDRTKLGIKYSIPDIIIDLWKPYLSEERMKSAFEYFVTENRTSIRTNLSKTEPEALKQSLLGDNIEVSEGACTPGCFKIDGYDSLLSIEAFNRGEFQVQDESSALVGIIAGIKAGDTVLDVCAAPGGKTIHVADILLAAGGKENPGKVISCDITDRKVSKIRENIKRCGFDNVEVKIADAEEFDESFEGIADVLIADLPCSGLGIIGKKPDIKYHTDQQKLDELVLTQRRILKNIVRYVKPGGTMIFSTCTVNRKENEENVSFICREAGFKPVSMNDLLPEKLRSDKTEAGMLQLIPGEFGTDGFFISKLRRD